MSAECRKQVDTCVSRCPGASGASDSTASGDSEDLRSQCERDCQSRCVGF